MHSLSQVINTLTGIYQFILLCLFHQCYQSHHGERREKEEKYWKRFYEKSSEEKNILTMENLFSEIPSEVKEFVEKNDTTGGGSFSESFDSAGNQNSNEEENKSESVEEISPPTKENAQRKENIEVFNQVLGSNMIWEKLKKFLEI